jgi:hypothetical protein
MLPKPHRPRETRVVALTRATYSIAEFCDKTGHDRATVLRHMKDGTLRILKIGHRRLIIALQAR